MTAPPKGKSSQGDTIDDHGVHLPGDPKCERMGETLGRSISNNMRGDELSKEVITKTSERGGRPHSHPSMRRQERVTHKNKSIRRSRK